MVETADTKTVRVFGSSVNTSLERSAMNRGARLAEDSELTRYFDNRLHAPCRIMVYTIGDPSYSSLACKRLGTADGARKPSVQFPSNLYTVRNRVELDKRVNVNGAIQADDFPGRIIVRNRKIESTTIDPDMEFNLRTRYFIDRIIKCRAMDSGHR